MTDTNSTDPKPTPSAAPQARGRVRRRFALAGALAALAGVFAWQGVSYAREDGMFCHHRHHGDRAFDPEHAARRIDEGVERMLSKVDATAEQKTKVADIAKSAMRDLLPLRQQHRAAREKALDLLTKPTIDRAALEDLRSQEVKLGETLSRRVTQALGDIAEVLTPEQRVRVGDRVRGFLGS